MTYVVQCIDGTNAGRFVARPGSAHSYTAQLQHARTWSTHRDALADCCENERVLTVAQAMGGV